MNVLPAAYPPWLHAAMAADADRPQTPPTSSQPNRDQHEGMDGGEPSCNTTDANDTYATADTEPEHPLIPYGAPPTQTFTSYEHLVSSLKGHAAQYGFDLVVRRRSTAHDGTTPRSATLACNRYGQHRECMPYLSSGRTKPIKTKKINCPFHLYASRNTASGMWSFVMKDGRHNHPPVANHQLLTRKRPSLEQFEQMEAMILLDIPSKTILKFMDIRYPENFFTSNTISEVKKRLRLGQLHSPKTLAAMEQDPWPKDIPADQRSKPRLTSRISAPEPPPAPVGSRRKRCSHCHGLGHTKPTCTVLKSGEGGSVGGISRETGGVEDENATPRPTAVVHESDYPTNGQNGGQTASPSPRNQSATHEFGMVQQETMTMERNGGRLA